MVDTQQLNSLAESAQTGSIESLWLLFASLSVEIEIMLKTNWWKIENEERFWNSCDTRIKKAVEKYNPRKGGFKNYAVWKIRELLMQHITRSNRHNCVYLYSGNSDGEEYQIEPNDDLAVVDDNYLVNERIASLAGDDSRRKFTLKAWSEGYFNDSELATLLTQRFGGNVERHRKFIRRFRAECQEKLLQTA